MPAEDVEDLVVFPLLVERNRQRGFLMERERRREKAGSQFGATCVGVAMGNSAEAVEDVLNVSELPRQS